jgi:RNA polymerase sigma-70 factor (ECF subfamily)
MGDSLHTQPSLLVRIRDASDAQAWTEFADLYVPLIYGFARKHGLQDADAADLTQDVLRSVAGAVRNFQYDPRRGSFRSWLFTVVRNRMLNFLAARQREELATGDTATQRVLDAQPARNEDHLAAWEQQYEQQLFAWAAERVRANVEPSTWLAFWKTAVEGRSGKETADELGLTVAAVYLAKSRVMARLKEQVKMADCGIDDRAECGVPSAE